MFCSKCGAQNKDEANFCKICGKEFSNAKKVTQNSSYKSSEEVKEALHDKDKKEAVNISLFSFNPKRHVKEYKRICNQCGKVWHSLASREEELKEKTSGYHCQECAALCGMCSSSKQTWSAGGMFTQAERNKDAVSEEINRLRKCPNCGSTDYKEEILIYEKQG